MFEVRNVKPRTMTVGFRVSVDEKTVLERVAHARNMRASDLARLAVSDYLKREVAHGDVVQK